MRTAISILFLLLFVSVSGQEKATISGKVIDVTEISYVHEHLKEDLREKIRAVVVETAGEKLEEPLEGGGPGWEGKEPKKIRQHTTTPNILASLFFIFLKKSGFMLSLFLPIINLGNPLP